MTTKSVETTTEAFKKTATEVAIKSPEGKSILLRKPPMLFMAMQRLRMAIGAEHAENQALVQGYMPLLYVAEIGDNKMITLNTMTQIDAVCKQLGDDGMIAVIKGLKEHFSDEAEMDKETVKK